MIQVREYALLTTAPIAENNLDCARVSEATLGWIQELNVLRGSDSNTLMVNGYQAVKLGSHVGFLQSPYGDSVEILPKTGLGQSSVEEMRTLLQRMLLCAIGVNPRKAGAADLLRKREPINEWIFGQFLKELESLIKRGLRFDYRRIEEESKFVRGSLMLTKQQRQPHGKQHIFHIEHDIFTADRLENRLLKSALNIVLSSCKSGTNWRLANELSHLMSQIPEEQAPLMSLSKWSSNKLMQAYDKVYPWCSIILEGLNPNFQKGAHKGISLLFPMETLFEKYVESSLPAMLTGRARLRAQASSKYLLRHKPAAHSSESMMFQLKPDLVLERESSRQVLDTKWKLLDQNKSDTKEKYNISQSDLYQLFAYGHGYQKGIGHMMLIYPKHDRFDVPLPVFRFTGDLFLWVVPFCLNKQSLVSGDWEVNFNLTSTDSSNSIKRK